MTETSATAPGGPGRDGDQFQRAEGWADLAEQTAKERDAALARIAELNTALSTLLDAVEEHRDVAHSGWDEVLGATISDPVDARLYATADKLRQSYPDLSSSEDLEMGE